MIPYRLMTIVFLLSALAYVGISYRMFEMPVSVAEAEARGFTSADFTPTGQLTYAPAKAWWVSFVRKSEYWISISIGIAVAFMEFALRSVSRLGGIASGAALGGGLLVIGAVSLSCIAPAMFIVDLRLVSGLLAGVPKWLMALNTLLAAAGGTLFLSRRLSACPVLHPADSNQIARTTRE